MKGISKTLKNNYKLIVGILIGLVLSIGSVYALDNIAAIDSEEVSYDNTESHGDYENVQKSIDELYERSGVSTTKWVDPILNGADPVLSKEGSEQGLIPVTIDPDGTVKYANLYTEWYNYSEKRWANAVILVDEAKTKYSTGDEIDEKDIESYFVWIPRYKYKIWNTGDYNKVIPFSDIANIKEDTGDQYAIRKLLNNSRIIEVVFGDTNHVIVDSTTKKSGTSGGTGINVNDYLIHPAFTLGDIELNGIWVGKFETGYNQDGENETQITPEGWTTQGAEQNKQDSTKIIIKPNVYSWRKATVKNFFMSAYNYKIELKSHMMKNTEWGAVAYLSHSSYGIGGEININNNKTYKTGYSSYNADQSTNPGTESTGDDGKSQPYNTATGYLASTTGNITGVYDMSGGAYEYVSSYISGNTGNSGFDNDTDLTGKYKDYFDVYAADSSENSYDKRILGDATGEMGPFFAFKDSDNSDRNHNSWYADASYFVVVSHPWFRRGGNWNNGVLTGQFYFGAGDGNVDTSVGFRLVLSIS